MCPECNYDQIIILDTQRFAWDDYFSRNHKCLRCLCIFRINLVVSGIPPGEQALYNIIKHGVDQKDWEQRVDSDDFFYIHLEDEK
ncbi:MAG: hypothetical protein ACXACY_25280 [Candidatus Hodarchaeales archaeon]|jgi:hypothetical protein